MKIALPCLAYLVGPLSCVAPAVWPAPASCGEEVTEAAIEAAWRDRQAKTTSFDLTWTEHRIRTAMFYPPTSRSIMPAGDIEHTYERRLVIEGETIRCFTNEPSWYFREGIWRNREETKVSDGKTAKRLVFVKGRATNSYQGSFFEAQALRELVAKEAALAPILLHFQPFVWKPGIQGGFKLAEGRHDLEGVPCVIIRRDKKDPHPQAPVVTESLWLDPAQQFSIRRHTLETGGKVYRQLDMQYRPDGAIPIPAAWQSVSRNAAGELTLSIKATVTSRKVNEDIPDAEFTITFPSGTRILTMP